METGRMWAKAARHRLRHTGLVGMLLQRGEVVVDARDGPDDDVEVAAEEGPV